MVNVILYKIVQEDYNLTRLVDDFEKIADDNQGVIIHEYDNEFLKATYWKNSTKKEYRYSIDKRDFELIDQQQIDAVDFDIEVKKNKLLVFGNKQMAQRIITILGVVSNNSYTISEYIIDIEKIAERACNSEKIELLKMRLKDICIEKGVLVNCSINLSIQDSPEKLVFKYISNIVAIAFKLCDLTANISIYRNGRISISKISEDERDEMIQYIITMIS